MSEHVIRNYEQFSEWLFHSHFHGQFMSVPVASYSHPLMSVLSVIPVDVNGICHGTVVAIRTS